MSRIIELDARYLLADDEQNATLLLSGDLYRDSETDDEPTSPILLTVIHEHFGGFSSYDLGGRFVTQLEVKSGESFTLIARQAGHVVGSLVNEVDTAVASRVLLKPKGGFHVLIHQTRCLEPQQVQVKAALKQEPTPRTLALSQLMEATRQHYAAIPCPLPETIRLLWPALESGLDENDEKYSSEMLVYLCSAIEACEIHQAPDVAASFQQAEALLAIPV